MPGYISDATGFPTTFDSGVSLLSDQANIVEAFKAYHYGPAYNGTGTPEGIEGHFADVYTYIAAVTGTNITSLPNLDTVGTIFTGTWQASTISPSYGGTGLSSYTTGDLIVASGSSSLSKLSDVATGNALISGGVGVQPFWGKIGLTTHVSGVLPSNSGGTGVNNGTNTITLGGNITTSNSLTTSGSGTLTLTVTGNTNVTLPTSGTLATTTGIDTQIANYYTTQTSRKTATVTTSSIASGAIWTGTITLGYSYRILAVETSVPARVRLYDTDNHLIEDTLRPIGEDPIGEHGVMMDMVTTSGNLNYTANPAIDGYNNESPLSTAISISVTNLSGSSSAILVTLTYIRSE